ncbi:MAG: hypothetical protein EHM79_20240 [Geobacter sp.]|nr:MAG: hypothetical protein EHM79_20240 [Geobacter sp.]
MKQHGLILMLIASVSSYASANEIFTTTTSYKPPMDCMLYITTSPQQGGTTTKPGEHFIQGCSPQTVEAIPHTGFTFSHWENNDGSFLSYENPITIEFPSRSIVAVFDTLGDFPNIRLMGTYTCNENPCMGYLCSRDVWSVMEDNDIYYLTKDWEWLWGCEPISWNGYTPKEGDSVIVEGEVSEATDYHANPYINIEVENLSPVICPIELIYKNDSWKTELLRNFRDNVLSRTPEGRELIKLYYLWSPSIIQAMENNEDFKDEAKEMINEALLLIQ